MKTVFTTGEAAKICKVSQQTIIRCFDSGQLKGFRVPGSRFRRIPRDQLYAFMRDNGIPTDALDSGKRKVLVVDDDEDLVELIVDALERGLAAAPEARRSVAIELGGGTGLNRSTLASRFGTLITIDISPEMLALVPDGTIPVLGDGSRLALPDGSVDALLLINMFLFPAEADRVVSPDGVVVWVSSRGPETPIYLAADEVDRALPGDWDGVAATAGYGTWSVHWRRST